MEGTVHIFGRDVKKSTLYSGLVVAVLGIAAFFYFRSRAAAGGTGAAAPQAAADQGGYGGGGVAVGVPNQAQADAYNKALQDLKDVAAGFGQRQQANQQLQQIQQQQLQYPQAQLGPGQTYSGTGQIQLAGGSTVVAGGGTPATAGAANVPAVYNSPSGQCAPGESQATLPDGRVLCGGNYGGGSAPAAAAQQLQPQQQVQQPQQDSHAAPPGTQCPPGQHWSYNQRQCRGNVNWLGAAFNAAAAFFTGGVSAPAAAYDAGITGAGGGGAGVSQQPYYNPSAGGTAQRTPSENQYGGVDLGGGVEATSLHSGLHPHVFGGMRSV